MWVIERQAGPNPRHQPVKGFFERTAPTTTMECLDPRARAFVQMRQRRMDFAVAMVVAAWCAVPTMSLQIVGVFVNGTDGQGHPGRALLVKATNQTMGLMPIIKWFSVEQ